MSPKMELLESEDARRRAEEDDAERQRLEEAIARDRAEQAAAAAEPSLYPAILGAYQDGAALSPGQRLILVNVFEQLKAERPADTGLLSGAIESLLTAPLEEPPSLHCVSTDAEDVQTDALTPADKLAQTAKDEALERLKLKIRAMQTHKARRAEGCCKKGVKYTKHLDNGTIKLGITHPPCRMNRCEECVRQRLIDTLQRCARAFLDDQQEVFDGAEDVKPRIEPLWFIELWESGDDWKRWEALDRKLCTDLGKECGRARLRCRSGRVLVVAEKRFDGATAMTPAAALDLFSAAVDEMDLRRHSFRLLGRWHVPKPKDDATIEKTNKTFDLNAIQTELVSDPEVMNVRRVRRGIFWIVGSTDAAARIWNSVRRLSISNTSSEIDKLCEPDVEVYNPWSGDG